MYATYILEYTKESKWGKRFYVGQSRNPHHRICDHYQGTGARWPRLMGVKRIVRVEYFLTREEALAQEKKYADLVHSGWVPEEQPCSFIEPRFLMQK